MPVLFVRVSLSFAKVEDQLGTSLAGLTSRVTSTFEAALELVSLTLGFFLIDQVEVT